MTTIDEQITHLLMDAAEAAGYSCLRPAEGFVGVIAPAKVCRLLEQIHARVAGAITERDEAASTVFRAAREMVSWDWRHLLIDHPDSDAVMSDTRSLDDALRLIGKDAEDAR